MFPVKSPIESLFIEQYENGQEILKPVNEILYAPVKFMCEKLVRPQDQIVYMLGSTLALFFCFLLKKIHSPVLR
jgi:hypothetical protein